MITERGILDLPARNRELALIVLAMAIGTAGFTAMLAVIALERHGLKPDGGEVLVTGAGGGVGRVVVPVVERGGVVVGLLLPGYSLSVCPG